MDMGSGLCLIYDGWMPSNGWLIQLPYLRLFSVELSLAIIQYFSIIQIVFISHNILTNTDRTRGYQAGYKLQAEKYLCAGNIQIVYRHEKRCRSVVTDIVNVDGLWKLYASYI